jgi:hypothetical protein
LLLDDRLPLLDELLRLLLFARARSLCAELLRLLAWAPLRPASERLMVPRLPLERDDEDELRDAIDLSFALMSS